MGSSNYSDAFLGKSVSKNMQQIYVKTLMPKCDINKIALHLY